jgi:hypothetical protein
LRLPVAKKSLASKPEFHRGDQKGIEGKFSRSSFNRKINIAWSSEKRRAPLEARKKDQIKIAAAPAGQKRKNFCQPYFSK